MTTTRKLLTLAGLLFGLVGLAAYLSTSTPPSSTNFLQVSAEEAEVMRAYVQFIAEYGRSYASKDQASQKYEVFKRNYETIKVFNKHAQKTPFVMAVNQFADMTAEEFAQMNRVAVPSLLVQATNGSRVEPDYKHSHAPHVHSDAHFKGEHKHVTKLHNRKIKASQDSDDSDESDDDQYYEDQFEREYEREYQENRDHHRHDREKHNRTSGNSTLPSYVNWVEKGAVTTPKDQQSCGSCWAFTTAATLESLAVISGFSQTPPDFSMQQLVDCDRSNDGCDGGWMYKAYNYTASFGLMDYEHYPYTQREGKCQHNITKAEVSKRFRNRAMVQETDLSNTKLKAIVAQQPVGVGIFTNSKFQFYKGGVMTEEYLGCSDPQQAVNHGVTVVGYGKASGEAAEWCDEYWLVRNSWGAKWGEQGYFKLCMDDAGQDYVPYGICQLNRYPTYPTMGDTKVQEELFV